MTVRLSIIFWISLILNFGPAIATTGEYDKFKTQMRLADLEHESGNFKSAIKIYRKVYAKSQLFRQPALDKLVLIYNETKDVDDAIDLVKADIAEYPLEIKNRLHLINLFEGKGDLLSALDEVKRAEKISVANEDILNSKYRIYLKLYNDSEAISTLNILIKIRPTNAVALLARAQAYYRLANYKKAFRDLQMAYTIRPYDELILTEYVKTSLYTKNYWIVDNLGKKCLLHFPKNASCLASIGQMYFNKKLYGEATTYLSKALAIEQDNIDARILFAESLSLNNRFLESNAEYRKILSLNPDSEKAMKSWMVQLRRIQDFQTLGSSLKSFNDDNPGSIWAAFEYAKLLLTVDAKKKAIDVAKRMNTSVKTEVSKTYFAYILYLAAEFEKSIEVLEGISEPKFNTSFNMGVAFFAAGDEKNAEKFWKQNLNNDQYSSKAKLNLVLLDEKNKKLEKSKEIRGPANEDKLDLSWNLPEL